MAPQGASRSVRLPEQLQDVPARDHPLLLLIEPGRRKRRLQALRHRLLFRDRPVGADQHMVCAEQVDRAADEDGMEAHGVDIDMAAGQGRSILAQPLSIAETSRQQHAAKREGGDDNAQLGQLVEGAPFEQCEQRRAVDRAAREPHAQSAIAREALVHGGIGDRMDEDRHTKRRGRRQRRPCLRRIGKKVALGALHEHPAQAEVAYRAGKLACALLAAIRIDGRQAIQPIGMLGDQLGDMVVDALDGSGSHVAVGILDEGCRCVDHPPCNPGGLDRREQGAAVGQVAVDTLPVLALCGRRAGQCRQREIGADIVIVKINDVQLLRGLFVTRVRGGLRRRGRGTGGQCRGPRAHSEKFAPPKLHALAAFARRHRALPG